MWCNKCKSDHPESRFTPTSRTQTNLSRWCNPCKNANRNYAAEYQKALPRRALNKVDQQKRREQARQTRKLRPENKRHSEAMRRARQRNAMPPWVTKEMKSQMREFYKNCPPGYEVDHIHPLAGKTACGLHVPWNLQYLPQHENRVKYNKAPDAR